MSSLEKSRLDWCKVNTPVRTYFRVHVPGLIEKSKITLKEAACNIPAIHLRLINPFEYIRIDFISEEIETTSGVIAIFIVVVVVVVVVFVLVLVTVLIRVIGLVFSFFPVFS